MSKKPQTLSSEQIKHVKTIFWKTLGKWFLIFIAVLTGITGFSLYKIKTLVEKKVEILILEQFKEPKINNTMKEVAENQAKIIIENNLNPKIEKATLSISEKTNIFNKNLNQLKDNYDSQLKTLKTEVSYIKQRNDLFKLGDTAIAYGVATALDKLNNLYIDPDETNEELKTIAISEILRIKSYFALMTRIKGVKLQWVNPKTKNIVTIDNFPTEKLIGILSKHENWKFRAKCAEHLRSRKEKGVPDALLNAIKSDPHLEVRKTAMDSFEHITGFKSSDVFAYTPASEWWDKNKENIYGNLKEQQTMEMYYKKNKTMESGNGEKDQGQN